MLQLYSNIKSRRLYLQMTQTELAHKMGYADKSMIAKIEKGLVDLPQSKILAFADVLGVSPGELMGLDGVGKDCPAATSPAAALPSPTPDDLTVTGLEKDIIEEYRAADSITKAMVLKALDIDIKESKEKGIA